MSWIFRQKSDTIQRTSCLIVIGNNSLMNIGFQYLYSFQNQPDFMKHLNKIN